MGLRVNGHSDSLHAVLGIRFVFSPTRGLSHTARNDHQALSNKIVRKQDVDSMVLDHWKYLSYSNKKLCENGDTKTS